MAADRWSVVPQGALASPHSEAPVLANLTSISPASPSSPVTAQAPRPRSAAPPATRPATCASDGDQAWEYLLSGRALESECAPQQQAVPPHCAATPVDGDAGSGAHAAPPPLKRKLPALLDAPREASTSERCPASEAGAPCGELQTLSPALSLDAEELSRAPSVLAACDSGADDWVRPAPSCAGVASTSGAHTGSVSREDAQAQLDAALASLVVYRDDFSSDPDEDAYYCTLRASPQVCPPDHSSTGHDFACHVPAFVFEDVQPGVRTSLGVPVLGPSARSQQTCVRRCSGCECWSRVLSLLTVCGPGDSLQADRTVSICTALPSATPLPGQPPRAGCHYAQRLQALYGSLVCMRSGTGSVSAALTSGSGLTKVRAAGVTGQRALHSRQG